MKDLKGDANTNSGFKPRAMGYDFPEDDVISLTSVDTNSTLTLDIAKGDVKKVVKILKRGDVDFVQFTGTIMLALKKGLKAEWIKALENPFSAGGL